MAIRYEPLRTMDRMLNDVFRAPTSPAMPLDLYRDGDHFIAEIDLPGVDPASIDIDVEDRTLTIRADRKGTAGKDLQWLTHERPVGTFARQLTLGYGVALDKIEAEYADGVLRLTIPVADEAKPRKISVAHAGSKTVIEGDQPAEGGSEG